MVKWVVGIGLIFVAIVFGVKYLVDFSGEVGRDAVTLRDGTVIMVPLSGYRDAAFHYKSDDLRSQVLPLADIASIQFSTLAKKDLQRHELTAADGRRRRCRVVSYANRLLTLKDPRGIEQTGPIDEVVEIKFGR